MSLVFCALSPHPPLLVPAIGKESLFRVEATRESMQALAERIVAIEPDTVVIVTPHGPVRRDAICMLTAERFRASFKSFPWQALLRGDVALGEGIRHAAEQAGYPVVAVDSFDSPRNYFSIGLDHATMVPLYYLREAGLNSRFIVLSIAAWSHRKHFEFGRALHGALDRAPERVVLLASGDLSHRLIPTAPAGYDPLGVEFDRRIVRDLENLDARDVLELEDGFIERIGECGLRPIGVLLGALSERQATPQVLSYEGPFGVGYCVALIDVTPRDAAVSADSSAAPLPPEKDSGAVISLVRQAVESFVRGDEPPQLPSDLPAALAQKAAAFVCLKVHGHLRGCIGTTQPTQPDLAHELLQNAVSAASRDPRFPPVAPNELPELTYSVDVLEAPEPIDSMNALDPRHYGVIVRSGSRSAVLLPNIEGIRSVEEQVEVARRKAGIGHREPLALQRFRARRYESKD